MRIIKTIKSLFKREEVVQAIDVNSIMNSHVYQAGGNIIINQQLPDEFKELLESMQKNKQIEKDNGNLDYQPNSTDFYDQLMETTLQDIKNSIDDGKIENAKGIVEQLIKTEGFKNIGHSFQIQIYYFKGIMLLEGNEFSKAEAMLELINMLEKDNKYGLELMNRLACIKKDEQLFQESIEGFKRINTTELEIEIKKIRFLLFKEDYDGTIQQLTKLEQIKEVYKENQEMQYYLGISYFNLGKYSLARGYLKHSNEISYSSYKEYLLILSEVRPVINRRGIVALISSQEKTLLEENLKNMLRLQVSFEEKSIELQEDFWANIFSIKILLNQLEVIKDIEQLPITLQQTDKLKYILGEAYALEGKDELAVRIYEQIYEELPRLELLLKIVAIYYDNSNYSQVLKMVEGTDYKSYKNDAAIGYILGMYFCSYYETYEHDLVSEKIKELESEFFDNAILFESIAYYFYKNNKKDLANEYIQKSKACIKADDHERFIIARSCYRMGMFDDAIEILESCKEYTLEVLEFFVKVLLQLGQDGHLKRAEELLANIIEQGEGRESTFRMKADVLLQQNKLTRALDFLVRSFDLKPNTYAAYNIVFIKLQQEELQEIDQYIDFLVTSDDPQDLMMGALAKSAMDKVEIANEISYKALSLLGNEFDEKVYMQYVAMHFNQVQRVSTNTQEVVDLDKVEKDSVIELNNPFGPKRYICINNQNSLSVEEGKEVIGCEQYSSESIIGTRLLHLKKDEILELDGQQYHITSIVKKHVYAFRYCMEKYQIYCPSSKYFQTFHISEEDPLTPLLPILVAQKERSEYILKQYNLGNGIGIPMVALGNKDYKNYLGLIRNLLSMPNQLFRAGELNPIEVLNNRVILSFSSIVFLQHMGLLDKIENIKDSVYITRKTLKKIQMIFRDLCEQGENRSGTLTVDENGRPLFIHESEKYREENINFWRNVVLLLQDIDFVEINESKHEELQGKMLEIIGDFEMDPILIEPKVGDIVICEDKVIGQMVKVLNPSVVITNSMGLVEKICSPEEILEAVLELSKQKYFQVCNEIILLKLIDYVLSKPLIVGVGTDCDKLKHIIREILSDEETFKEYLPVLRNVIYKMYEKKINPNMDILLELVIREIKLSAGSLNFSSPIVLKYLLEPAGIDACKEHYITRAYKQR
ncbi:hypothetical protein ABH17_026940 (plasmid) [Bacillus toyonensis]|uniref:PIN domain-containing protein n=1 Tax=Bacillus toyonensis TaxID=155322 RepID=UPI0006AA12C2|nr:hypothetical protein [Bacillus toyonensis]OKO50958.1 hypothetical protein ABH17_026940 [Bacillus toyonensis]